MKKIIASKSKQTYSIEHSRTETEYFESLDAAKDWQEDMASRDYEDYDHGEWVERDPADLGIVATKTWEFVPYDANNEPIEVDTSDGSGWYIDLDFKGYR